MKTLYLECGMGASGDMLAGALLELLPEPDRFVEAFHAQKIPKVTMETVETVKCGIKGTHVNISVAGKVEQPESGQLKNRKLEDRQPESCQSASAVHSHHHLCDIERLICEELELPEKVKTDVLSVYTLLAQAESKVHGVPVSQIHFHEVGEFDAIADITAVCMLLDAIAPERILVSPICTGWGKVVCAHGILPVPAPATVELLKGIPVYGGTIQGELCTPTGAALLRYFADDFVNMPAMTIQKVGYGMGTRDFPEANCVRAVLGESQTDRIWDGQQDVIVELACNLDDMTPEEIGFAQECLWDAGVLDVYTEPIGMKKSRPGTLLCVQCKPEMRDVIVKTMFRHTTTLGIRESLKKRYLLQRQIEKVLTPYGEVRCKCSSGYGVQRKKWEYEDLAHIVKEQKQDLGDLL